MTTRRASDSATRFKFTAIGLKQLKHDGQRAAYTDAGCAGLSYRVTASNARSFSFSYRRPNGQKTRETFGDIPLAEAHALAADLRKRLRAGEDPAGSRLQRRQEDRTGSRTFGALAAQYLEIHAEQNLRARTARNHRQTLDKHVLPKWGDRRYDQITRKDVIVLLDEINKKRTGTGKFTKGRSDGDGGPSAADHARAMLKTIFNFAIRRDDLAHNPVLLIARYNKNVRAGRPLTDAEARLLYSTVMQAEGVKPEVALGLRVLLLTGCRRHEISGLSRDELHDLDDPQQARIELPPARTKKNKWLVQPLSPAAVAVVKEALAQSKHGVSFSTARAAPPTRGARVFLIKGLRHSPRACGAAMMIRRSARGAKTRQRCTACATPWQRALAALDMRTARSAASSTTARKASPARSITNTTMRKKSARCSTSGPRIS